MEPNNENQINHVGIPHKNNNAGVNKTKIVIGFVIFIIIVLGSLYIWGSVVDSTKTTISMI